MKRNVRSVEQYVAYTTSIKRFEVKIKKGITIFLFAVGMTSTAAPIFDIGLQRDQTAEITLVQQYDALREETPIITLSLRDNITSNSDKLYQSLLMHGGGLLSTEQKTGFNQVANQLQTLNITDVFVRYNETEHHITFDLLLENNLILHLTQYYNQPSDQLVYSIEKNDLFVKAGYTPIEGFGRFIARVIDEVVLSL